MKSNQKSAVRFFCVTLAVLLLSTILIWGFQSSWGGANGAGSILVDQSETIMAPIGKPVASQNQRMAPVAVTSSMAAKISTISRLTAISVVLAAL